MTKMRYSVSQTFQKGQECSACHRLLPINTKVLVITSALVRPMGRWRRRSLRICIPCARAAGEAVAEEKAVVEIIEDDGSRSRPEMEA